MKRSFITLALIALFVTAAFAQTGAATSNATAPAGVAAGKVGVINIQQAILYTNQGKRDFDVLTKKFEPKRAELAVLNDELEKLKKDLNDKQAVLSEEDRSNRVRVIDKKTKDLQRQLDDAQNDFNSQSNDIAAAIGNKMMDMIDKYSRANGIIMVIDVSSQQSQVLWASETVNIGPAIVEVYNTASGVEAPVPSAPGTTGPKAPGTTARPPAAKPATPAPATTTPKKPGN